MFNRMRYYKTIFSKKIKGSFTVEATLIFPLIMFIMFAIIYLTIVHYQNNVMIAESIRAMNRAGAYYQYIDMGLVSEDGMKKIDYIDYDDYHVPFPFDDDIPAEGLVNFRIISKRSAYRSLIDIISEAISNVSGEKIQLTKKKSNAKKYVESRISNVKFKQYTDDENTTVGDVSGEGFMFVGNDLSIEVKKTYINPLHSFSSALFNKGENKNFFLNDGVIDKVIKISSVISNQAEFIRNLDTIYDLGVSSYKIIKPEIDDSTSIDKGTN